MTQWQLWLEGEAGYQQLKQEGRVVNRFRRQMIERYKRRVIERILSQYEDDHLELDNDDIEYLLSKMGQLTADTQLIH